MLCDAVRLSVFAGGWTLEAAEAVCAGTEIAPEEILDLLAQLVDKSLVVAETLRGEARYRMLETTRQYARHRLVEAGEAAAVQARHQVWYLGLAERAEASMRGQGETLWLTRLELEHDNLRAALGWTAGGPEDAEIKLRFAAALWMFWDIHTHWGEGERGWRARLPEAATSSRPRGSRRCEEADSSPTGRAITERPPPGRRRAWRWPGTWGPRVESASGPACHIAHWLSDGCVCLAVHYHHRGTAGAPCRSGCSGFRSST
jgi:hypothetical protein